MPITERDLRAAYGRKTTKTRTAAPKPLKDRKLTPSALAAALVAETPDGWVATTGQGYHDGFEAFTGWPGQEKDPATLHPHVTFARDGVCIALNVKPLPTGKYDRKWAEEQSFAGCTVEGHTTFDGRTFTRRGIDVSSCDLVADEKHRYEHDYDDVAALLAGEYDRCAKARARQATAVPVPGLPFTVQPDWFAAAAATLKAGKSVSLTPAGFGTGYTLRPGVPRSRWTKRADPALEAKLGVGAITVETFDHD
jgi:hypothetical protein